MSLGTSMKLMRLGCIIMLLAGANLLIACGDGSSSSTPDHSDGDVNNSEVEASYCVPEARKCLGNDVNKCNASGTEWVFFHTCEEGTECRDGDCVPVSDTEDGDIEGPDTDTDTEPDTDVDGDEADLIDDDMPVDGDDTPEGDLEEEDDDASMDEETDDIDTTEDDDNLIETPDDVDDTDDIDDYEDEDTTDPDNDGPTITFTRVGNLHAIADYESYRYFAAEASDDSVVSFSITRALPEGVTLTNLDDGTAELMVVTPQSVINDAPFHQYYLLEATTDTGGYASELFGLWIHPINPPENDACDSPITVKVGDVVWGFTGYANDSFNDPPLSCNPPNLINFDNDGLDLVYRLAVSDSSIQRLQFSMVNFPFEDWMRPANYIYFSQTCDDFGNTCEKLDEFDYRSSVEDPELMIYDVVSSAAYFVVDTSDSKPFTTFSMEITPYYDEPGMICEDPVMLPEGETLTGQTLEGHENVVTLYGAYSECSEGGDAPGRMTGPQAVYTIEARAGIQYRVTVEPEDSFGGLDLYIFAQENTLFYPLLAWVCKDSLHCRFLRNKKDEGKAEFVYFNIFETYIPDPNYTFYHQLVIGDSSQTAPQGTFSVSVMPEQCAVFHSFNTLPRDIGNNVSIESKYISQLLINDFHITLELDHPAQEELRIELIRPDSAWNEWWDDPIVLFDGEGSGQFGRKTFNVLEYQGHVVTDRRYMINIIDNLPSNENQGQVLDFTVDINRDACLNRPCNSYDDCPASNMRCQVYPKQCVLR